MDNNKIIKDFNHIADIEELQIMTDNLNHSGTNQIEKKETEQEAWRTVNAMFENEKRIYKSPKRKRPCNCKPYAKV